MKKILMSAAAVAMFFATGCSNEELVQNPQAESREFSLTVNKGTESRTVIEGNVNKWDENDAVYVFSADGSVYGVLKIDWNTVSSDGKTATFTGTVNGAAELKHVVFPAPEGSSIPTPGDLKIHINHVDGAEHNAPMYGEINGNSSTFEHVGGLVKFDVNGVGKGQEIEMTAKVGDKSIAGGFYKFENGELKYYENPNDKTTIHNVPTDGVFYLPIASDKEADTEENAEKAVITGELVDRSQQNEERVQIISESNVAVSKGRISDDAEEEITLPENVLTPVVVADAEALENAIIDEDNDIVNVVLNAKSMDFDSTLKVFEGKIVTINLNGCTLNFNVDYDGFENEGVLNIKKGDIVHTCNKTGGAAIFNNKGKLTLEYVNVTSNDLCVYTHGYNDAEFRAITDFNLNNERKNRKSVVTVIGGKYVSNNTTHGAGGEHPYAFQCFYNSEVNMENAYIEGDGGLWINLSDATLKNVVRTVKNCDGHTHGVRIAGAGRLEYDETCQLGPVYAQFYGVNGGVIEDGDELWVNGTLVNEENSKAGAYGGLEFN